jgi:hypothetical protein
LRLSPPAGTDGAEAPEGPAPGRCRAGIVCDLAAYATVRLPLEQLAEFRRQPGPVPAEAPLPASFLKHADEQTVAGLTAVYQAIHSYHLPAREFTDWGVVAAPRFLGRSALAVTLQRFRAEGAWGVSPHLIPHRSLHSLSGTVSQALKIHGPNFGVGGGPGCTTEVLLAAFAMLHGQRLPGVWVVLTATTPEVSLAPDGQPIPGSACIGLALALVPAGTGTTGIHLQMVSGDLPRRQGERVSGTTAPFNLEQLQRLLGLLHGPGETTLVQLLSGGSRLELRKTTTNGLR